MTTLQQIATPKNEAPYCQHLERKGGSYQVCYSRPAEWVETPRYAVFLCSRCKAELAKP